MRWNTQKSSPRFSAEEIKFLIEGGAGPFRVEGAGLTNLMAALADPILGKKVQAQIDQIVQNLPSREVEAEEEVRVVQPITSNKKWQQQGFPPTTPAIAAYLKSKMKEQFGSKFGIRQGTGSMRGTYLPTQRKYPSKLKDLRDLIVLIRSLGFQLSLFRHSEDMTLESDIQRADAELERRPEANAGDFPSVAPLEYTGSPIYVPVVEPEREVSHYAYEFGEGISWAALPNHTKIDTLKGVEAIARQLAREAPAEGPAYKTFFEVFLAPPGSGKTQVRWYLLKEDTTGRWTPLKPRDGSPMEVPVSELELPMTDHDRMLVERLQVEITDELSKPKLSSKQLNVLIDAEVLEKHKIDPFYSYTLWEGPNQSGIYVLDRSYPGNYIRDNLDELLKSYKIFPQGLDPNNPPEEGKPAAVPSAAPKSPTIAPEPEPIPIPSPQEGKPVKLSLIPKKQALCLNTEWEGGFSDWGYPTEQGIGDVFTGIAETLINFAPFTDNAHPVHYYSPDKPKKAWRGWRPKASRQCPSESWVMDLSDAFLIPGTKNRRPSKDIANIVYWVLRKYAEVSDISYRIEPEGFSPTAVPPAGLEKFYPPVTFTLVTADGKGQHQKGRTVAFAVYLNYPGFNRKLSAWLKEQGWLYSGRDGMAWESRPTGYGRNTVSYPKLNNITIPAKMQFLASIKPYTKGQPDNRSEFWSIMSKTLTLLGRDPKETQMGMVPLDGFYQLVGDYRPANPETSPREDNIRTKFEGMIESYQPEEEEEFDPDFAIPDVAPAPVAEAPDLNKTELINLIIENVQDVYGYEFDINDHTEEQAQQFDSVAMSLAENFSEVEPSEFSTQDELNLKIDMLVDLSSLYSKPLYEARMKAAGDSRFTEPVAEELELTAEDVAKMQEILAEGPGGEASPPKKKRKAVRRRKPSGTAKKTTPRKTKGDISTQQDAYLASLPKDLRAAMKKLL